MPPITADSWAATRVGIFFPASSNNALSSGDLDGQCVSLDKWFLSEVCSVPNPGAARGHAKDYGNTLVAQGHAIEVPAAERKAGDIVVWPDDGGQYGHTGVLLNNDRVFEQNVGLPGSSHKYVRQADGRNVLVFAARIDPLFASWRTGAARYYRIKTYKGAINVIPDTDNFYYRYGQDLALKLRGRVLNREEFRKFLVGQTDLRAIEILSDDPEAKAVQDAQTLGMIAVRDNWRQQIADLLLQVKDLAARPTKEQLASVQAQLEQAMVNLKITDEQLEQFRKKQREDSEAGESFMRRLGQLIQKVLG